MIAGDKYKESIYALTDGGKIIIIDGEDGSVTASKQMAIDSVTITTPIRAVAYNGYLAMGFNTDGVPHIGLYDIEGDSFPLGAIIDTTDGIEFDDLLSFHLSDFGVFKGIMKVTTEDNGLNALVLLVFNGITQQLTSSTLIEFDSFDSHSIKGCEFTSSDKVVCVVVLESSTVFTNNLLIYDLEEDAITYQEIDFVETVGSFTDNFSMTQSKS